MWLTQGAETVPGFHATLTTELSRLSGNCFPRPFPVAPFPSLLLPRYMLNLACSPVPKPFLAAPVVVGICPWGTDLGKRLGSCMHSSQVRLAM